MKNLKHIVIAGVPRSGKTTVSDTLEMILEGVTSRHTDSLMTKSLTWSETSAEVVKWFDDVSDSWIIEGTATVRALRKWMNSNKTGKPCDIVFWFNEPVVFLEKGQATMRKGCFTIFCEIEKELMNRKVEIIRIPKDTEENVIENILKIIETNEKKEA